MVDGVTGLKVSGYDMAELRDAMASMMDRDLREMLGRQARQFAEENKVEEPFTAVFDSEAMRRKKRHDDGPDEMALKASDAAILEGLYFANDGGERATPRPPVASGSAA
jgi:hypothetical protein